LLLSVLVVCFWGDSFAGIGLSADGVRKGGNFRALSIAAEDIPVKFAPRCRHLDASDYVLAESGLISPVSAWYCLGRKISTSRLSEAVSSRSSAVEIAIASVGRDETRRLEKSIPWHRLKYLGFSCKWHPKFTAKERLLLCRKV
jgi:hypothetical protein